MLPQSSGIVATPRAVEFFSARSEIFWDAACLRAADGT